MAESDQHTDPAPVSASPNTPVKGILKKGKSEAKKPKFESGSEHHDKIQWDEMNILMTEHPADKDYGHMKIDEPKTPYHENMPDEEEEEAEKLFTDALSRRVLEAAASKEEMVSKWEEESSGSEEESLTDEQKEHKRKFREWRKKHYNEFHAVKRARELIKKEEELEKLQEQQQQQQQQEEEDQKMEVDPETGGRTTDV